MYGLPIEVAVILLVLIVGSILTHIGIAIAVKRETGKWLHPKRAKWQVFWGFAWLLYWIYFVIWFIGKHSPRRARNGESS